MRSVTSIQMKEIENRSEESGVSKAELMDNAGAELAGVISKYCFANISEQAENSSIVFLAGSGNNGGDCFVAAKILSDKGFSITVVNLCGKPHTDISEAAFRKLSPENVNILRAYRGQNMKSAVEAAELDFMMNPNATMLEQIQSDEKQRIESVMDSIKKADVLVDGVFGTGFHGQLDKEVSGFLNAETSAYKIAVDVPSGGNCESGQVAKGTFKADLTAVFGALKVGMIQYPLKNYCGEIVPFDIGIPEEAYELASDQRKYFLIDKDELKDFPKNRKPDAHKGSFGRVLCIAGSSNMRGAASLSALAAFRCGAGLVTLASVEKAIDTASILVPEATFCRLEEDEFGFMQFDKNAFKIRDQLEKADAIVLGCGMGVTDDTVKLTRFVIENANCPIILDADGINCVASDIDMLLKKKTDIIITPHPGEMAKLLGCTAADINESRVSIASDFAKLYGVTVVLKGAGTVIADLVHTAVNETGNPGMSCGGSGDVLAGIVASLAAQGYSVFDSACFGTYIHGVSGDIAAEKLGQEFMLPRDIIDNLSDSIKTLK